jgi:3-hydroxyacyl-[acyl-carrier-protein] dehydratase
MPPKFLVDPTTIDTVTPVRDIEDIRRHNKQRFEFEMLDGVAVIDLENELAVAYKHVNGEEFWVRGHIPGRPLFPGVLQIEAAAQLTSFYWMESMGVPEDTFIGFMGVTDVKFRGFIEPGDVLIMAAKVIALRSRRCEFACQGFVKDKLVFEGIVMGAPM